MMAFLLHIAIISPFLISSDHHRHLRKKKRLNCHRLAHFVSQATECPFVCERVAKNPLTLYCVHPSRDHHHVSPLGVMAMEYQGVDGNVVVLLLMTFFCGDTIFSASNNKY
jgi:hypothetical protein